MKKSKYYRLDDVLKYDGQYYILIGERSNGKTYSILEYALMDYVKNGRELAYIRRYADDIKGSRARAVMDTLILNGEGKNRVIEITGGQWNTIYYYGGAWYLAFVEEGQNIVKDVKPWAYAFSLSGTEHNKSTSYNAVGNVFFEEFLTRQLYLPDEFVLFMNTLSTIIRLRTDVRIFMAGNTINKYAPYFEEMGLVNVPKMKKGDIDVYTYGDSKLRVIVQFTDSPQRSKENNAYFAFNNPKLNMITGAGNVWEIDIYPHAPTKWKPSEILFTYFIEFQHEILQCEIIQHDEMLFTFIHRKSTPVKDPDNDLIFSEHYSASPNKYRSIKNGITPLIRKLYSFYVSDRVFYQNNEVGEIVRNYLNWCKINI